VFLGDSSSWRELSVEVATDTRPPGRRAINSCEDLQASSRVLDSRSPFLYCSAVRSGVGLLCNLMIRVGGRPMLLNSRHVISRSQHEQEFPLLRRTIEELTRNTVDLIAEAEKLIQESKQLSEQIKSLPSKNF
jgi:hypothetical protein